MTHVSPQRVGCTARAKHAHEQLVIAVLASAWPNETGAAKVHWRTLKHLTIVVAAPDVPNV